MTDDLVKRLGEEAECYRGTTQACLLEAKERIEQLEGSKDRWKTAFLDLQKASEGISDLAMKYKEALTTIGYGPPNEGNALTILNEFVDIARAALGKEGDKYDGWR
jgi:hypothetical protein